MAHPLDEKLAGLKAKLAATEKAPPSNFRVSEQDTGEARKAESVARTKLFISQVEREIAQSTQQPAK